MSTKPENLNSSFLPENAQVRSRIKERVKDPKYLPKLREVIDAFMSPGWESALAEGKDISKYEDGQSWHDLLYKDGDPLFEFLTQEYISGLADYLSRRVQELGGTKLNPIIILEVGAGNGRLTNFLQEELNKKMPGQVKIVATDPGNWNIAKIENVFPVEKLGNKEALKKYNPKIVISCWMPLDKDFTADFRATPSVQEYLLIGENGDGTTGKPWETWGWSGLEKRRNEAPPYKKEGFRCDPEKDLEKLSYLQICRTNKISDIISYNSSTHQIEIGGKYSQGNSETVSFKRNKKKKLSAQIIFY